MNTKGGGGLIYNLHRKQQKQQVTITSNSGFYLNNVFQKQGTYTAQVGDAIKVNMSSEGNLLFEAKILFDGQVVKQHNISMGGFSLDYSFNISDNYQNIQLSYTVSEGQISGRRLMYFQCYITTT